MAGIAAGDARNLIRAPAASGSLAPTATPAANTVTPLNLWRQWPDKIDARHGQQLADLLEADLMAARDEAERRIGVGKRHTSAIPLGRRVDKRQEKA
jgi:hypothetical protein